MLPYILFSTVVYWTIGELYTAMEKFVKLVSLCILGFVSDAGKFFYFMLMVVLTALAGNGVTYTVGAAVTVYAVGSLLVALIFTFMMVSCLCIITWNYVSVNNSIYVYVRQLTLHSMLSLSTVCLHDVLVSVL